MAGNQESIAERRHCVRQKVHAPAFASFNGVTGGMILDLSEEGLSMQTAVPYDAGRAIRLQLDLPEPAGHLETTGYIAWADALGRAGVRFSDLPEEVRQRLRDWLTTNATAPSRIAPKFAVGAGAPGGAPAAAAWPGGPIRNRAAISVEAETDVPEARFGSPQSRTAQYEFLSFGSDLKGALQLIAERARSLTRGSGAAIALASHGSVICRATAGIGVPALGTRLDVNSGLSGECLRTGVAQRCDDTEKDLRVDLASCREAGIRAMLTAPIRYERDVLGLLAVFAAQPFCFDEGDVAIVESLAHTVVLAMSQASALKKE